MYVYNLLVYIYIYILTYLRIYMYLYIYMDVFTICSVPTSLKQPFPGSLGDCMQYIFSRTVFQGQSLIRSLCSSHGRGKVGRSLVLPSGLFLVLFSSGSMRLNLHMPSRNN